MPQRRRLLILAIVGVLIALPAIALLYVGVRLFGPLPATKLDWASLVNSAMEREACYEAGQIVTAALDRDLPGASAVALRYYEHPVCGLDLAASHDYFRDAALKESADQSAKKDPGFFGGIGAAWDRYFKAVGEVRAYAKRFRDKAENGSEKSLTRDMEWIGVTCDLRLERGEAAAYYWVRRKLAAASGDSTWLKPGWERLYKRCAAEKFDLAKKLQAIATAKPDHKAPIWWEGFARAAVDAKLLDSAEAQTAFTDDTWNEAWMKANPGLL